MSILIIVLYILSFLLIWQFVGYPLVMALLALKSSSKNIDIQYQPYISIIVPTYNEERAIVQRIINIIELEYPKDKYELIIVDSGSNDKTADLVEDVILRIKGINIRIIYEKTRNGKASAINFGKKYAKGDIVLITDANCIFDKNVLLKLAPHFKNPKVGAVGGRYIVMDPTNSITKSTQFYWDIEYIMRKGEASLDSACLFHGEINAWRKNLVDADTKALSEDLDMAINIRKQGYKIDYEPEAVVYEHAPSTTKDQIKQRKRTSIGTIQNIFKHSSYLMMPHDLYSLLIFPSHKTLTMLSPFFIILIPILYFISFDLKAVIIHFIISFLCFIILFIILMFLKSKLSINDNASGEKFNINSILSIIKYVFLNEYLILLAWNDFLFGRYSVLWEKAETTR